MRNPLSYGNYVNLANQFIGQSYDKYYASRNVGQVNDTQFFNDMSILIKYSNTLTNLIAYNINDSISINAVIDLIVSISGDYINPTKITNSANVYTYYNLFNSIAYSTGQGGSTIGVSSFNTRTGAVTLSSSDVTTALGYTPLSSIVGIIAGGDLGGTYPNPSVIWTNGYGTYDTRYAPIGGSVVSSFNTRTGAITLLSADVTGALGYTPYNGGTTLGGDLSGTLPNPTVRWANGYSTYDTRYLQLGGGTLTGFLTLNANPTNSLHAATKSYVDNLITGISWKNAVMVMSVTNITLSGVQTIDGYTTANNDRVLVNGQTNQTENGLYLVNTGGSWTRTTDANTGSLVETATVFVERGTTYKDTQWTCTATNVVLGTTNITFGQISGAGTYSASTGITLTANVFTLNLTYTDGRYNQRSNNLSDVASVSTARTNLGLGTIATQNANAVAITGGTIDGTTIGATTPANGTFNSLSSVNALSSTGTTFNVNSGLLYTTLTGTINTIASQSFATNNGTNGSSATKFMYVRDNAFISFGAFDQLPVKSATITNTYPNYWGSTSKFNELIRIHNPYTSTTIGGAGALVNDITLVLGTVDVNNSGLTSKVAFRHGYKSNVGFSEYYNNTSTTTPTYIVGGDRFGQYNGITGVYYTDANANQTTFNTSSSYIGFDNASYQFAQIHARTSDSASQGVGVLMARCYATLTFTSWSVVAGNKLLILQNGNNNNTYSTQFLVEGNGSIRSLGGLQLGFSLVAGYIGGAGSDIVRMATKGLGATSSTVNFWLTNSTGSIANNTTTTGALMKVFDDGTTEHYGLCKVKYGSSTAQTSLGTAGWVFVGGTNINNISADTSLAGGGYISTIIGNALSVINNKLVGKYDFVSLGGGAFGGDITISFAGTNIFTSTGLNTTGVTNTFSLTVTIYVVSVGVGSSTVRVVANYIGDSTIVSLLNGRTSIVDISSLSLTTTPYNIVITSTNAGGTTTTLKSAFEQWLY